MKAKEESTKDSNGYVGAEVFAQIELLESKGLLEFWDKNGALRCGEPIKVKGKIVTLRTSTGDVYTSTRIR